MQNVVFNMSEIIERLKYRKGYESDADLARDLGVHPKKLGVWKLRNTVPLEELTTFCMHNDYSLEWALTGSRDIQAKPAINDPRPAYAMFTSDTEMQEIVTLLQKRVPELKGNVLKILKAKAGLKEALSEMGLKEGDWF